MLRFFFLIVVLATTYHMSFAQAFETIAKQAFLIDYDTGTILMEKNADEEMAPSSMSKLMTLTIAFERLKKGELSLTDKFTVSEKAWKKQGSKMFVRVGHQVSAEELLKGIIVQSGNDACIVLAEGLAGTEEDFSVLMNEKAKEIGLKHSHFTNSTGWPDPEHYMTAHDLAILATHLLKEYPAFYSYFTLKDYTYNNIKQENRNVLLNDVSLGVDGLKTGSTDLGGYGIVVSAKINERRLILVLNGLESMVKRADEARRILTYGFSNFANITLFKKSEVIEEAKVWLGTKDTISLVAPEDLVITTPKHQENIISVKLKYNSPIKSPIKLHDQLAELQVFAGENNLKNFKILAQSEVKQLSFFRSILKKFQYYLFG
jgi:D-alanyl-D-alanine carboxypeptidase (penicillin-binding protein 5/6)